MDKILLKSKPDFNYYLDNYWEDDSYVRYAVSCPDHFPCVAILEHQTEGELGAWININTFVYLEDFNG